MTVLLLDGCSVDLARRLVRRGDAEEHLTAREVELLAYLAARPGRSVSHDELLADVWGYRAGLNTRAVYYTFRRLRAKVERDPGAPRHLITVHGTGYRFEPLHVAPSPDPTSFVGRAEALAEVASAFDAGARIVTVLGLGGMGKTRLARHFTAMRPHAYVVHLTEAWTASEAAFAVAAAVGDPLDPGTAVADAPALAGVAVAALGEAWLVLDNFEQLVPAAVDTVARWRKVAPDARFLVTSRVRLGLEGEWCLDLPPLSTADGVRLFCDRARSVAGSGFDETDPAIEDIVRRLDGIPLAIELAAARSRLHPPATLLARLSVPALTAERRDAPARHATLVAVLEDSWALLSEVERVALVQCTVFRGGFTVAAAEGILQLPGNAAVEPALAALRDASLLRLQDGRLSLFAVVAEWAADRLEDRAAVVARHARWFAALGDAGVLPTADQLAQEHPNLVAAFAGAPDAGVAARIALTLDQLYGKHGPMQARAAVLDGALAREGLLPGPRARLLRARGSLRREQGREDLAVADIDAALVLAREAEDAWLEARLLCARATLLAARDVQAAFDTFRSALAAVEEGPDQDRRQVLLAANFGAYLAQIGRPEAEPVLRDGLAINDTLGEPGWEGWLRNHLATVLIDLERFTEAEAEYRLALAACERAHDQAYAMGHLAVLALFEGRAAEACSGLEEACARAQGSRETSAETFTRAWLGIARVIAGDRAAAEVAIARAESLATRTGYPLTTAFVALACAFLDPRTAGAAAANARAHAARSEDVRWALRLLATHAAPIPHQTAPEGGG